MRRYRIKSYVYLLLESEGGRTSFIKSHVYRPNILFTDIETPLLKNINISGELIFDTISSDVKLPGEIFKCEIDLIYFENIQQYTVAGKQFIIREGDKKVGVGIIVD